ncbi:MBL fold metallo-hydrolase [Embleya sp. MST-111070]|uniref:MBL fold metallo-hydrolase n=1 Tax=Embleya sp. MST-111070 TaxID=3398231 RepID=UPI003F734422
MTHPRRDTSTPASARTLPVADNWFTATPIDDTITRIHEPHVHEFLQANIWHLRGTRRSLVVDAGLGVAPLRPAFPDLFTDEPILVLTHAHLDHMGGAHEFADRRAHRAENAGDPPPGALVSAALFAELGLAAYDDAPDMLISALPQRHYDPDSYRLRPAHITRHLADGDTVDLGDRQLTVLHVPGHSPGGIALYDPRARTLFSGDTVYDDELLDDIHGADRDAYAATMSRLRDLPVTLVHPGHGPSFDGARLREIADAYLTAHTARADRAADRPDAPSGGSSGRAL